MYKVGITGGIGSGKSTICKIFQTLGIPVYDADSRGKMLLQEDPGVRAEVLSLFGEEAYLADGTVNRVYLAEKVFSDSQSLDNLNAIVHPVVRLDMENWLKMQTSTYVLKEAAILIESGAYKEMDEIIAVEADVETRIKRVVERDSVDVKKVQERVKAQLEDEERKPFASYIINNNEGQLLIPQVLKIHENIISRASS